MAAALYVSQQAQYLAPMHLHRLTRADLDDQPSSFQPSQSALVAHRTNSRLKIGSKHHPPTRRPLDMVSDLPSLRQRIAALESELDSLKRQATLLEAQTTAAAALPTRETTGLPMDLDEYVRLPPLV